MSRKNITRARFGYTLVELLVVISIVALMLGLAVPALLKIGGFLSSRSDDAARELYGILRAARMYSITFRTDTAVFYSVTAHEDTLDGGPSYVADGFGIARRADVNERARIAEFFADQGLSNLAALDRASNSYVAVESREAYYQQMPRGTCITGYADVSLGPSNEFIDQTIMELPPQDPDLFRDAVEERGMVPIFLFHHSDQDGLDVVAFNSTDALWVVDNVSYSYPAHVFKSSGDMLANSPVARFVVNVGPAPDAPVDERFTDAPNDDEGDDNNPVMVAPVRIELFRTTGRVKITS